MKRWLIAWLCAGLASHALARPIDVRFPSLDRDAELERLLAHGATPVDVGQGADATWDVLADPEGNEFCILMRRSDLPAELQ